jgi:predicted DNA-binding protein
MDPTTLMSPFRLPVRTVERLKNYAKREGRSITYCLQSAIASWLDDQEGEIEKRALAQATLKEEREKAALAQAESAKAEQLERDIGWLERWKMYSPGKLAPWPKGKPIPAGYESMIDRGEEEI